MQTMPLNVTINMDFPLNIYDNKFLVSNTIPELFLNL